MSCWRAAWRVPLVYPTLQKNERIAAPGVSQICFQLFLSRADPRCVVFLRYPHTVMVQQNRDSFNRHSSDVSRKRCGCPFGSPESLKSRRSRICQLRTMLSSFPLPLQKKNFSLTFGVVSNADNTNSGRIVFTGTPVFCV